jgi:hypothetical protein
MPVNAQLIAEELIAYTVVTDKNSLVKLLERNGVEMPNNPSDKEVTIAVLTATGKSNNFKNELSKLLTSKIPQAADDYSSFVGDSSDFGFTGLDDFSFTGVDDFVGFNVSSVSGIGSSVAASQTKSKKPTTPLKRATRVTAENPQGKTQVGLFLQNIGKSVASQETINSGINIGLSAINNKVQGRQNNLQQETVVLTQKQDELRQQLPAGAIRKGLSPMTMVLIGLGVVAIGATIYFVTKKKVNE